MRHAFVVAAAIAFVAGCAGEPRTAARLRARDRSPAAACADGARHAHLARSLESRGRLLRALVLADRAVWECPALSASLAPLRASAAAGLGRCDRAEQLGGAAARTLVEACRKRFAEGDPAQSRATARSGERRLASGDRGGAIQSAQSALESARTVEALLLYERAVGRDGSSPSNTDIAFAALEKSEGSARLELAPAADDLRRAPSGDVVATVGDRIYVYRAQVPDLGLVLPWSDPAPKPTRPDLSRVGGSGLDRFAIAGANGIDWLDPTDGAVVDHLPLEGYALRELGTTRMLATKLRGEAAIGPTVLLDTFRPDRLSVRRELDGPLIGSSTSDRAFLLRRGTRIEVHDFDGAVIAGFEEPSDDVTLSGRAEKVAGCTRDASGSHVWVWDVRSASLRFRVAMPCGPDSRPRFSPNDRLVSFAGASFDADTGERALGPLPPPSPPSAPAWMEAALADDHARCPRALSGDGALVVTGCAEDLTVRAAATGEPLLTGRGPITLPPSGTRVVMNEQICDVALRTCANLQGRCDAGTARLSRSGERVTCARGGVRRSIALDPDGAIASDEAAAIDRDVGPPDEGAPPEEARRALIAAGAPSDIERAGLLSSGWLFATTSDRRTGRAPSGDRLWLVPIAAPERLFVTRWTSAGMVLVEPSRARSVTLRARAGDGGGALVCRFGDRLVAPLRLCEEAFLADEDELNAPFSPWRR